MVKFDRLFAMECIRAEASEGEFLVDRFLHDKLKNRIIFKNIYISPAGVECVSTYHLCDKVEKRCGLEYNRVKVVQKPGLSTLYVVYYMYTGANPDRIMDLLATTMSALGETF